MKVIYLDQNKWINLSQAAYGFKSPPGTPGVLEALRHARTSGRACFPLSYAHYQETLKRRGSNQRQRLAKFMLELSGGMTMAPPSAVIPHEIEVALAHCFPGRVVPAPFQLWGSGAAHALVDRRYNIPLEWPSGADAMPAPLRTIIEGNFRAKAELTILSGVSQLGEPLDMGPATSLTTERDFKASLEKWAGTRSRDAWDEHEFERETYTTNLHDIDSWLQDALARHHISREEFDQLGELRRHSFLEDMPWQKAEMHLKRHWAKNRNLKPHDSDLIDWGALSLAVSYCDIVVTEKQKADLFSRDSCRFRTAATVVTQLGKLPELVV